MANQVVDNKYTWVIKNYSSVTSKSIRSDIFVVGGCQWRILASNFGFLKLILGVLHCKSLPHGRRRDARCLLTIVNQNPERSKEALNSFQPRPFQWFSQAELSFTTLKAKDGGFLVNDELKIVAEIDVSEEAEELARPIKKIKLENDAAVSGDSHKETQQVTETINVHGFHILPSQVNLVSRIFEKYPDIGSEFRAKNQHLRTACLNVLLGLIKSLCQPPKELSYEDLLESDNALAYVKDAGFKVDWLEKRLEEVKEKKEEERSGEARIQELEKELNDIKQTWLDMEILLANEKAKVLAAQASLALDDFF